MREPIFTEKLHSLQQKLFSWLVRKHFFHLADIPGSESSFSRGKRFFLTNSSFRLVEANFRFSRKSIVLFSALLKILKIESKNLFKRILVSARGSFGYQKLFFSVFQIFLLVRGIFVQREHILNEFVWWRRIFYMVETNFMSCRNRFLLFNIFFCKWKPSLKLVETNLFGKDFVPVERDFPLDGTCFLLFCASFLQV